MGALKRENQFVVFGKGQEEEEKDSRRRPVELESGLNRIPSKSKPLFHSLLTITSSSPKRKMVNSEKKLKIS